MLKETYKLIFLSVGSMIGSTCTTVQRAGHFNLGKLGIETRASNNRLFVGNCTVKDSKMGLLKGAGFCQVKRSSLKSISVAGTAILFEVLVQDTAKVAGWLKAEKSRFNSAIRVCSDRVDLVDCNTQEIAFTAENSDERVEKLF